MSKDQKNAQQTKWQDKKIRLSSAVLALLIVATVCFVAGTRSEYFYAKIAPLFGRKISSDSLDLSEAQSVYRLLKANFDGDIDSAKLSEGAISGLVAGVGDPHTTYLNAAATEDFERSLNGKVSGIGVEIGTRGGQPTILRTVDNSPAKKAELQKGDIIRKIGDTNADGFTPGEAAELITGEQGTTVKLTIDRDGETKVVSLTRAEVSDPSVAWHIQDEVGVLRIRRFDSDTGDLARRAAEGFRSKKVKAVIVDLRDNGGGLLDQSQSVAGLWLDKQLVLKETSRHEADRELFSTGEEPILANMKTVILTNGSTASASEIVAGALRDHGKATLVGEKTFGKGTVQQVINLAGGGRLKVTIAHWFTPKGTGIAKKGIEPDVKIELSLKDSDAGRDPQFEAAMKELAR